MSELTMKTQGDIPAKETLAYMRINDVNMAEIKGQINLIKQTVENLDKKTDTIITQLNDMADKYAEKSEFQFWRNILVGGILIAIFLGVVSLMLDRVIK